MRSETSDLLKLLIPILLCLIFAEPAFGQFIESPKVEIPPQPTTEKINEIYKHLDMLNDGLDAVCEILKTKRPKGRAWHAPRCLQNELVNPHRDSINTSLHNIWIDMCETLIIMAEKQRKPTQNESGEKELFKNCFVCGKHVAAFMGTETTSESNKKNWPPEAPIVCVPEVDSLFDIQIPVSGMIVRVRSLIPPPGAPPQNPYLSYFIYKDGWESMECMQRDTNLFMNCFICGKHVAADEDNCFRTDYWGRVVLVHPKCQKPRAEDPK